MRTHCRFAIYLSSGLTALLLLSACRTDRAAQAVTSDDAAPAEAAAREYPGLHNVIVFADGLINGSAPHGEAGFDSLEELGIKSIICVDGAHPDVAAAEQRGMRYVHVPIKYDGITHLEQLWLIRAIRELPKPIYIHCFHGRHRSPAAAACALVSLGRLTPDEGRVLLTAAGTSPKYAGLYAAVEDAAPVAVDALDQLSGELPTQAPVSGLAAAMAAIARTWDHLRQLRDADWQTLPDHPDLHPRNESRIMAQLFAQLVERPELAQRTADYQRWMRHAAESSRGLALSLEQGRKVAAHQHMAELGRSCTECHALFRNN
jgi:protein tyrosine phosphatase (PTP) superfamily phosphohydrolase (DUF442 family)